MFTMDQPSRRCFRREWDYTGHTSEKAVDQVKSLILSFPSKGTSGLVRSPVKGYRRVLGHRRGNDEGRFGACHDSGLL